MKRIKLFKFVTHADYALNITKYFYLLIHQYHIFISINLEFISLLF